MGRVILHAGMHKTGTSTIQVSLSSGLNNSHYVYLDLGEPNHSGPLVNLFGEKPENYHGNKKRGLTIQDIQVIRERLRDSLNAQLSSLDGRTAIISAEDACRFSYHELSQIRDSIRVHGHDIYTVIYLRPPRGYIESAFQQLIKGGQSTFNLENAYPRYSNLGHFSAVFGETNCTFRLFSKSTLHLGDVLLDFLNSLDPGLMPTKKTFVNEGISLTALKFIYAYRKYGPGYGSSKDSIWRNNSLVGRLAKLPGEKLRLDPNLTDPYFQKRKDDLDRVASLLGSTAYQCFIDEPIHLHPNVHSEDDLLSFTPQDVEHLVFLAKALNISVPEDHHSYVDPKVAADLVSRFMPSVASNQVSESTASVLHGNEGFLFLAGGKHSPYAYAKGRLQVNPKSIRTFWKNIQLRREQMHARKIAYLHLVVPDKHNICEEAFPEAILTSLFSEYLKAIPPEPPGLQDVTLYPLQPLKQSFRETCYRVDTHLTPLGCLTCLDQINAGLIATQQPSLYGADLRQSLHSAVDHCVVSQQRWSGDLGSKLVPPVVEERFNLPDDKTIYFFTNNFTGGNNGICDIYVNTKLGPDSPSVVLFGDSFGRSLAKLIARIARQVVFCRTPFLHLDIVGQLKPSHVISQNVERYLSSVASDRERTSFWFYPFLKDTDYRPPVDFVHAINAVTSIGRPPYDRFISDLQKDGLRSNPACEL
jgi:hypothetical protein